MPNKLEPDRKLPVMMWIHGGAFLSGSGPGNDVPQNQAHYTDGRGLALDQGTGLIIFYDFFELSPLL